MTSLYREIMNHVSFSRNFVVGNVRAHIYDSKIDLGAAAAKSATAVIRNGIQSAGRARIIVATGNSQLELIDALANAPDVDWRSVEIFHMDEYVGIAADHPSSFRYWIKTRVEEKVHPLKVHYLAGDAKDVDGEIVRYSQLLNAGPIHLAFVGFGENGHIAFNDPPVADFEDPLILKRVALDDRCRQQQTGEGHFPAVESVPKEALTITCTGLFRAERWICCVPDTRKAEAVRGALEGPISTACPASMVRMHPNAKVFLDSSSAALLSEKGM
jgi:glucosamine-6-phosphate deaminase